MMAGGLDSEAAGTANTRRVLMTTDAVGGVWRYSLDLAVALRRHRVQTMLAVLGPLPTAGQRGEARRAGVPLAEYPCQLEWMNDGERDLAASGQWLLSLERSLRPDVVHLNGYAHGALPWRSPALIVAHSCVRTWWMAVRRGPVPPQFDRYTEAVTAGLHRCRAVVAPTRAMLTALTGAYAVAAPTQVVPNGYACAQEPTAHRRRDKAPVVLAAGRAWDEAKNIGSLGAISHRLPWPVVIAGPVCGPDGARCGLGTATALGQLSANAMRAWYRKAAIYALPARYEPFGLSVLEAAHAGCALVLGDIASLRENWHDAALFVPPDDGEALAAAIGRLIADRALRTDLSERARARALDFPIERTAAGYLQIYEALAA